MLGTRAQLLALINEDGIPMSKSTLDRHCMPSNKGGPPVAGWWGRRPLYDLDEGRAWARSLLTGRPVYPVKAGPGRKASRTDQHQNA
jgi:hypothetical protein